jgi:hypothetical protein
MARHGLWPTPNVPTAGGKTLGQVEQRNNSFYRNGKKTQLSLQQAVRLWPTPTARDWRSGKASEMTHQKNSRPLSEEIGGSLNPTWVDWLMHWPLEWEARGPMSLQTFRVWLTESLTALHGLRR